MSWKAGEIVSAPNTTFAGGVATGTAYKITFSLYKDSQEDFLLLTQAELYQGIALSAHHTRNLSEGAGSACLRAAFKIRNQLSGKKVVIQMSGGNASRIELQKAMVMPCLIDGACRPPEGVDQRRIRSAVGLTPKILNWATGPGAGYRHL